MSNKSLFATPFMEKFRSYEAKLQWSNASTSDSVASLNAFTVWLDHMNLHFFSSMGEKSAEEAEKRWAKSNFLQVQPLRATYSLLRDVERRLTHLNIKKAVNSKVKLNEFEKALMLKIAIGGAFYPQYFVRGCGLVIDEREAIKTLNNHDPFSTVYLSGMPSDQPVPLYAKKIKELLSPCAAPESIRIAHDSSSKIFIQFHHSNYDNPEKPVGSFHGKPRYPGRIHTSVYGALKLRQLRVPMRLDLLHPEEAQSIAKDLNLITEVNKCFGRNFQEVKPQYENFLPEGTKKFIAISVTHVEDPDHFWVIYKTEVIRNLLATIQAVLNEPGNLVDADKVIIGNTYAVMYREAEELYYRARILSSKPKFDKRGKPIFEYRVYFIDYGNQSIVSKDEVKEFGPKTKLNFKGTEHDGANIKDIPDVAIECSLAEVKPSLVKNSSGLWTQEAIELFKSWTLNEDFHATIYSVVYGKVAVELAKAEDGESPVDLSKTINALLIEKGLAEKGEEGLMSKMDYFRRQSLQNSIASFTIDDSTSALYSKLWELPEDVNVDEYTPRRTTRQITLRGPTSPLEMKVYPLCRSIQRKGVSIEPNSVNSILLDSEPQNPNDRLLVAGSVGTNESGDNLTLRDTTLMPNIRGLTGILCLLFSPSAELRTNKQRTKITGALCGLGYDPLTNQSYYPANDLEIGFDAEITLSDIELINRIRVWLNQIFCCGGEEAIMRSLTYQSKIKDCLFQLIKRKRRYQNLESSTRAFKWNVLPSQNVIQCDHQSDGEVFKLHSGVSLEKQEPLEVLKEIRLNLCELFKIAHSFIQEYSDGICKLCNNVTLPNRMSIQVHIVSTEHRDNEQRLFKENLENFKEIGHLLSNMKDRKRSQLDTYGQAGETMTRYTPTGKTGLKIHKDTKFVKKNRYFVG